MFLMMFIMLAIPLGLIVQARLIRPLGLSKKARILSGLGVVVVTLLAGSAVPLGMRYAKNADTYLKFGFETWTPWLYYFVTFLCLLLIVIIVRDIGLFIWRCVQWAREHRTGQALVKADLSESDSNKPVPCESNTNIKPSFKPSSNNTDLNASNSVTNHAEDISAESQLTAESVQTGEDRTAISEAVISAGKAEDAKKQEAEALSRRQFLSRISSAAVVGGAFVATPAAIYYARDRRVVKHIEIELESIPAGLNGLRIVHLSDIHVGNTIRREDIEAMVKETNALNPDIVAITGDLCEGHPEFIGSWLDPMKNLKAKYGSYFVTGNHDHMWGARAWNQIVSNLGVRVLDNAHEIIDVQGTKLAVCGVLDLRGDRKERGWKSDPVAAMAGIEPGIFKLMLAHQPGSAEACFAAGANLMLVGHTHGGQFWPICYIVDAVHKYSRGLYYVDDKAIFVSCGTGYWGPPLRFGIPPEIDVITLKSKA
ncbi:MAG: metallophosphoesterase [Proteobacteria bacterium]|nr:metallophosphoesterase [Pseudomonadota bacterium]